MSPEVLIAPDSSAAMVSTLVDESQLAPISVKPKVAARSACAAPANVANAAAAMNVDDFM